MSAQQYRITTPTLAFMFQDGGSRVSLTIPLGGEVEVMDSPLDGNRLVHVFWERKVVMMFTTDIRERAEPLHGPTRKT